MSAVDGYLAELKAECEREAAIRGVPVALVVDELLARLRDDTPTASFGVSVPKREVDRFFARHARREFAPWWERRWFRVLAVSVGAAIGTVIARFIF